MWYTHSCGYTQHYYLKPVVILCQCLKLVSGGNFGLCMHFRICLSTYSVFEAGKFISVHFMAFTGTVIDHYRQCHVKSILD